MSVFTDSKYDHYRDVQDSLRLRSVWSMYNVEHMSDEHTFEGATKVVYKDHWGLKPVEMAIIGKTWKDLFVIGDSLISMSGDDHHVFIEDFVQKGDTLYMVTGS